MNFAKLSAPSFDGLTLQSQVIDHVWEGDHAFMALLFGREVYLKAAKGFSSVAGLVMFTMGGVITTGNILSTRESVVCYGLFGFAAIGWVMIVLFMDSRILQRICFTFDFLAYFIICTLIVANVAITSNPIPALAMIGVISTVILNVVAEATDPAYWYSGTKVGAYAVLFNNVLSLVFVMFNFIEVEDRIFTITTKREEFSLSSKQFLISNLFTLVVLNFRLLIFRVYHFHEFFLLRGPVKRVKPSDGEVLDV
mmetsp:Transcript_3410/g.4586  ORF Transcript_3410/g.4586 Transcript_3410/m.4586 type:complete len:253 (-) Transcript_3410:156-914(-)